MRKQVYAVTIGVLLVLSVFSVLRFWQIKPAQATELFNNGFEDGNGFTSWTETSGTTAINQTVVHSGVNSTKLLVSYTASYVDRTLASKVAESWIQFEWQGDSVTSSDDVILDVNSSTDAMQLQFGLYDDGGTLKWKLHSRNDSGWLDTLTATSTPSVNTWYIIKVHHKIAASTGVEQVWVDNVLVIDLNGLSNNDRGTQHDCFRLIGIKTSGTNKNWFFDDAIISDADIVASTPTEGDGVAASWDYRISQNDTACYLINDTGTIWDSNTNPAIIFNNAMLNCTSGGSIYVYPDTYNFSQYIGSTSIWGNWTDIYVLLGAGTILNWTSGAGYPYMLDLIATGAYVVNFTLTSNGTAYFDGNGLRDGWHLQNVLNSTFANLQIEHCSGYAIYYEWIRYCLFENMSLYSFCETNGYNAAFTGNDLQYCTYYNITIDGNNEPLTRGAVYIADWAPSASPLWDGSYFNNWTKIWIKNVKRTGFYLNSGAEGNQVYNNTFTNCTIENNWESGYNAIKLRPAQNNTFTEIIIRNWTEPITTGTSYLDGETAGNCTGNYIQAQIYNSTVDSLVLTADDNNQEVSDNFFNLTVQNGKGTYFSQSTNSPIKNNIIYMNFTDCTAGIWFEQGNFTNNTFYLNFTRCGSAGHSDIYHSSTWGNVTNNTFYVYETSGNPNGLYDFVNGTQGNIVIYPYSYSGPPPTLVTITIISPTNSTYTSSTITVQISVTVSGSTLDKTLWNAQNGTSWIYVSNNTYTVTTQMTGIANGIQYTFHVWANATDGTIEHATVMFSVSISAEGIVEIFVNTWWSGYW